MNGAGGKFSKTIYRIISLNDNYTKIYKEFIGEELEKPQTLDNSQSQPCTEKPCTVLPCTENPTLIRIIDKEESPKEKSSSSTSSDDDILKKFNKYPPERVEAAMEVMRKRETAGQKIKNRTGYLRRMLENGFEDLVPASAPMRRPAEYKHPYFPQDSECTPLSEVLKNYFSLKN